jgi:hypothetical protein
LVANIIPTAPVDGIPYCTGVPLTNSEADLGDGLLSPHPIPTEFGQAISAVIQLTANGLIVANTSYVVMQMDMGNSVWVDMNWLLWTGNQGTATFVFSNGIAANNTLQQSRNIGSPPTPQANGSNQLALGGRIRFTGQTIMTGGSSSLAGVTTAVSATIRYKLLGLR